MQAIHTKFIPATNYKPARIKATCARGSISVCYHSIEADNQDERFAKAARALCEKFADEDVKRYGSPKEKNPWLRPFVTGCLKDGSFAHVFIS